jgi:glycyl-tRNA synthetase
VTATRPQAVDLFDKITSLAKRRGFVFPSSEIYGGVGSTWDYGPLGVELKNNIKRAWWRSMVQLRDDVVGLDAAILMHPRVWEASGHVENFTDPLVDCRNCKRRYRLDELPGGERLAVVWLRPETAQGIYVNFQNVVDTAHRRVPFGIAQIGKAFRNEITPGNFIFRSREFEQMEMQYFVHPDDAAEVYERWLEERFRWYAELGIPSRLLRRREHAKNELAHYAARAVDVEFEFPFGWKELEGVHNRTDYDLRRHQEYSGKDLSYFDDQRNERYIPHIVETSAGADRSVLAFLCAAYEEEPDREGIRAVLRLDKSLAPIKVAVLPLSKKPELSAVARDVWATLRPFFMTQYDETQSIGRRYRRQDEIGTPLCVTVDFDTLVDKAVTIRDRDSMTQERVAIAELVLALRERLAV